MENKREYKRQWMRHKRHPELFDTPAKVTREFRRQGNNRPIPPDKCQRCEILLKYGGGDKTHCENCLNEMGML